MNATDAKRLKSDPDGLITYEFLANNIDTCTADDLAAVVDNMIRVDFNGQFTASAARYLNAIAPDQFRQYIDALTAATIAKDREHRYLAPLATALYGNDLHAVAAQLNGTDNNFRRIYKRLYPNPESI